MKDLNKYDRIVFFGDSIFFGHGVSVYNNFIYKIAKELKSSIVTNCSHNGDTTRMALDRFSFDIQPHWFDTIVIQFGNNDANYWISDQRLPRVSPACFKANLIEIIDRSYQRGIRKIFLCTSHPMGKTENFPNMDISLQSSSERYNRIIRDVSSEAVVELIDIEREFPTRIYNYLLDDLTHLNEKGHDVYYHIILPYVRNSGNIR